MVSVNYAVSHYKPFMLSVIMLNVVWLSVVAPTFQLFFKYGLSLKTLEKVRSRESLL
jgi:hypothetical protein